MPPQAAVRTEELLNYFRYDYPRPARPVAAVQRHHRHDARRRGTRTRGCCASACAATTCRAQGRPAANLVFLVDVSGSMDEPDKLPLVQCSLALLAERLNPRDRVAIVVYAGAAGAGARADLEPRRGDRGARSGLQAGGSTAGAPGIQLAYQIARGEHDRRRHQPRHPRHRRRLQRRRHQQRGAGRHGRARARRPASP